MENRFARTPTPVDPGNTEPLTHRVPACAESETAHAPTERTLSVAVPEVDARASLTVISGPGAGRSIPLGQGQTVLGRAPAAALAFEDMAVSRSHARVSLESDGWWLDDLGSTNGTLLGGQRVKRSRIESGDRFQLGPNVVVRFAVTDELERNMLTRLVESSTRDPLTGTFNRAFFGERLDAEIAYALRHETRVAVLLLDLDHFKAINDTHGHAAGDHVLQGVSRAIARCLRAEDVLARYGGEEFAIMARATTRLDAVRLGERVRDAVSGLAVSLADGTRVTVTASIGVASLRESPQASTSVALFALADARLYKAKADGRNAVRSTD